MPHYTHKPLPIFAIQYTGDNAEEIINYFREFCKLDYDLTYEQHGFMRLWINGAITRLPAGTYIIRNHNGNISVMGEKEFEDRYEIDEDEEIEETLTEKLTRMRDSLDNKDDKEAFDWVIGRVEKANNKTGEVLQ